MRIGETSGTAQAGITMMAQPASSGSSVLDAQSNEIRTQIDQLKKNLQLVSSDDKLTDQEKLQKKKEIEAQIAALTQSLHDLEVEKKQEKNEIKQKVEKAAEQVEQQKQNNEDAVIMDPISMEALIKAGSMQKSVEDMNDLKEVMQGEANIKRAEIKTDVGRGQDVSKKQEEINSLENKVNSAEDVVFKQISKTQKRGANQTNESDDDKQNDMLVNKKHQNKDKDNLEEGQYIDTYL